MRRIFMATLVASLLVAAEARAQVEVQPFGGIRFGGDFNTSETIPGGSRDVKVKFDTGVAWGATVGVSASDFIDVEFLWSRQDTHVKANTTAGRVDLFDAAVSHYHGDILFDFTPRPFPLRPFLLLGFGATTIDPDASGVDSATKFSYAVGAGLKANFSRHVGIRLQGRFTQTHIKDEPALFCDPFGVCYTLTAAQYANQGEFTAGIIFRF